MEIHYRPRKYTQHCIPPPTEPTMNSYEDLKRELAKHFYGSSLIAAKETLGLPFVDVQTGGQFISRLEKLTDDPGRPLLSKTRTDQIRFLMCDRRVSLVSEYFKTLRPYEILNKIDYSRMQADDGPLPLRLMLVDELPQPILGQLCNIFVRHPYIFDYARNSAGSSDIKRAIARHDPTDRTIDVMHRLIQSLGDHGITVRELVDYLLLRNVNDQNPGLVRNFAPLYHAHFETGVWNPALPSTDM